MEPIPQYERGPAVLHAFRIVSSLRDLIHKRFGPADVHEAIIVEYVLLLEALEHAPGADHSEPAVTIQLRPYTPDAERFAYLVSCFLRNPQEALAELQHRIFLTNRQTPRAHAARALVDLAARIVGSARQRAGHNHVGALMNRIRRISEITLPAETANVLHGLQQVELLVHAVLAAELDLVDHRVAINSLTGELRGIRRYGTLLANCYLAMVTCDDIMTDVVVSLGKIPTKFSIKLTTFDAEIHLAWQPSADHLDPPRPHGVLHRSQLCEYEFLRLSRRLVLVCLAASVLAPPPDLAVDDRRPGFRLLEAIVMSEAFSVELDVAALVDPGSFIVGPTYPLAARAGSGQTSASRMRLQLLAVEGTPAVTEATGGNNMLRRVLASRDTSVSEQFCTVFAGSLSFNRHLRAFYTPARIEFLHELIHGVHNANGANQEKIAMSDEDERIWSNEEERETILGHLGENAMGAEFDLPERWGHGGVPLAALGVVTTAGGLSLEQTARGAGPPRN